VRRKEVELLRLFLQYQLHLWKWGISLAWPLGTFVDSRASKRGRGIVERDENKPWKGEWKRRGGCMLLSPTSPQMEGGAATREEVN
jgi:hypothetical protein